MEDIKTAQKIVKEQFEKRDRKMKDDAMSLFRERWWDRFRRSFLYEWVHGIFMGRAGEILIIIRKDNKIAMRSWVSKIADSNQNGTFADIQKYIYYMGDNMAIVEQYWKNQRILGNMIEEYRDKHGSNPTIDELLKKPTIN